MLRRLESLAADPRARRAGDVLLALGLGVAALLDLLLGTDERAWGGRGPLQVALVLLLTVPLVWRVRFPIAAAALENAASGCLVILAAPHQPSFEVFVADTLAMYSLGAHTGGRRAWGGLALMFAIGIPLSVPAQERGFGASDLVSPIVWTLAFFAIGQIIRGRRRRTAELEALTLELERQRELQAQAAVTVERGRIARELHDVIAHNVSMIVVQAGAAARVLAGEQPDVSRALEAIETTGRATVDEMRRLLGVLRSADDGLALAPQPGLGDLDALVESVRGSGLPVELRVEGTPATLPPGLDLTAYRIAQEALTNVLKHAGQARAAVTVRYGGDALEIEVRDDGRGFRNGNGGGHGLVGMRERAALWGGRLEAGAGDEGWVVRARLPLEAAPA